MAAAVMLVAMSVPLGFLPVHLSMAVLAGILVGPGLGFVSVFVVNVILALVGHGGITIVGLNTLVIGLEVFVGAHVFRFLSGRLTVGRAAFFSVIPALVISMVFMVGIVGLSADFVEALPHHDCQHDHNHTHSDEHGGDEHHESHDHDSEHDHHEGHDHGETDHTDHQESFRAALQDVHFLALTGGLALALILILGITLEAGLTALIIGYIHKVKPDLIFER